MTRLNAKLATGKHFVTARNIGLKLTKVAAGALNAALGTKLFSAGLRLGTAGTIPAVLAPRSERALDRLPRRRP